MEIKRKYFTKEQRNIAAKVDIRDYLNDVHPDLIKSESKNYSRYLGKRSVSLSARGYCDNNTGEAGNSIDFVMNYLCDGNLIEAVSQLYEYSVRKSLASMSQYLKAADKGANAVASEFPFLYASDDLEF